MKASVLPFLVGAAAASALLLRICARADELAAPTQNLSVTATPAYVSQYMFRGLRLGGQSFEPEIEGDCGNWAFGIWANEPLSNRDKVPGQSDPEIDPYGSYTFNINDGLSIEPGFTWYTYLRAPTSQGHYRMTFEPNIALNCTVSGMKFTPRVYYDVVLKGPTYELSAVYAVPLKDLGTELDFLGTGGLYRLDDAVNCPGPSTKATGDYWLAGASVPFQVTKGTKLAAGVAYTKGGDAYFQTGSTPKVPASCAVGRVVVTVSCAWTF